MALEVLPYRFQIRGGTAAALSALNEVPLRRELIIELDTGKAKLGDGDTAWNALDYLPWNGGALGVDFRVDGGWIEFTVDAGETWQQLVDLEDLRGEPGTPGDDGAPGTPGEDGAPGPAGPPGPSSQTFPTASFDGGLGTIEVGKTVDLPVDFGFDINGVTLIADVAGILEVDIRVDAVTAHPPTSVDTICGAARPRLLSQAYYQDNVLDGWTTEVPSGSVIRFVVTACTGIKQATLVLKGVRS